MATAKLFENGSSQAVRLPKEFRFLGKEVLIRRVGDAVILEPLKKREWPKGFFSTLPKLSDDFARPSDAIATSLDLDLDDA